jgi:hypothetical protein
LRRRKCHSMIQGRGTADKATSRPELTVTRGEDAAIGQNTFWVGNVPHVAAPPC